MPDYFTELAPNLACETIVVSPFEQNCRIIWNKHSKSGILIDPGSDWHIIKQKIAEKNIDITAIWLTHGHLDHAGEAMEVAKDLGVEIFGPHMAEKPLMDALRQHVDKMQESVPIYRYFIKTQNCTPDHWLKDGDILKFDKYEFKVMHWPGHSPGHVVYYCEELQLLIAGDVVFADSVGRTDLFGSDQEQLMHNIRHGLLPLPDDLRILAGHGRDFTLGEVRHSNPFLVRWGRT